MDDRLSRRIVRRSPPEIALTQIVNAMRLLTAGQSVAAFSVLKALSSGFARNPCKPSGESFFRSNRLNATLNRQILVLIRVPQFTKQRMVLKRVVYREDIIKFLGRCPCCMRASGLHLFLLSQAMDPFAIHHPTILGQFVVKSQTAVPGMTNSNPSHLFQSWPTATGPQSGRRSGAIACYFRDP